MLIWSEKNNVNKTNRIESKKLILYTVDKIVLLYSCLLYTSDAADERSSVDLGGRRIIKKKKKVNNGRHRSSIKQKHIREDSYTHIQSVNKRQHCTELL